MNLGGIQQATGPKQPQNDYAINTVQQWFDEHVRLNDEPYTLDFDQTRAVIDSHENTLVTARAGSGKTRVIVAKVVYLVAQQHIPLEQIAIFMFNRTAAAEVNQRITAVKVDGVQLVKTSQIASTFHKYALDILKISHKTPRIINEEEQAQIIHKALEQSLQYFKLKPSPQERKELLSLVSNFIVRAGQNYPGDIGQQRLRRAIVDYCKPSQHLSSECPSHPKAKFYHRLAYSTYLEYLAQIPPGVTDFNNLMWQAAQSLKDQNSTAHFRQISHLKYIMVDEYQDFSYLFLNLINAIRSLAPTAKLFAVGDDWQAINRFAGSDVDYFLNFKQHFPQDSVNIPLATNYRSAQRIVDRANQYMLTNYNSEALPARASSHTKGKIKFINPAKQKFDQTDYREDGLGDGRYLKALSLSTRLPLKDIPIEAARLLKLISHIVQNEHKHSIMLLHRHNFTTFPGVTLINLYASLENFLTNEHIMSSPQFKQQIRCMTMHKSKGLEADVVILLEMERTIVQGSHPHATIFQLFGDTRAAEIADQQRLLYVAITRAKHKLYILSSDKDAII